LPHIIEITSPPTHTYWIRPWFSVLKDDFFIIADVSTQFARYLRKQRASASVTENEKT